MKQTGSHPPRLLKQASSRLSEVRPNFCSASAARRRSPASGCGRCALGRLLVASPLLALEKAEDPPPPPHKISSGDTPNRMRCSF